MIFVKLRRNHLGNVRVTSYYTGSHPVLFSQQK